MCSKSNSILETTFVCFGFWCRLVFLQMAKYNDSEERLFYLTPTTRYNDKQISHVFFFHNMHHRSTMKLLHTWKKIDLNYEA